MTPVRDEPAAVVESTAEDGLEASASAEAPPSGQARRRLRTRAALLGAGRELLIEGRTQVSIEELTKRAGVGFGSFYNHFETKEELFGEALFDVLDAYAAWLREATDQLQDPAEIFAASFRMTGRLASASPALLAPLLSSGTEVLLVDRGLRAAALEDLARGVRDGRFVPLDPNVLLMTVGGALLGLLRLVLDEPTSVPESIIDQVAQSVLRMLGVPDDEALALVSTPVATPPDVSSWVSP
jgi:AcrR family transcriptional regulator